MTERQWITEQEAERSLLQLEEAIKTLRRRARAALVSIHEQSSITSGWPERGSGGAPLVVSPVEAVMMRQHAAGVAEQQLASALSSVASELNQLAELVDEWSPLPAGLCDGGDPPWGDAVCSRPLEQYTKADGTVVLRELCSMHRKRRDRCRPADEEATDER